MNPRAYRKRPILVEAVGPITTHAEADAAVGWIDRHATPRLAQRVPAGVIIRTREGDMTASYGDYIIRGAHGEFYPCKPDVFATTYDALTLAELMGYTEIPMTVVADLEREVAILRDRLNRIREALEEAQ